MILYDLLSGLHETEYILNIDIFYSNHHYHKVVNNICNYKYSDISKVVMFKATKKGLIEIWSTLTCGNIKDYIDITDKVEITNEEN